jgi:hypothetical protein
MSWARLRPCPHPHLRPVSSPRRQEATEAPSRLNIHASRTRSQRGGASKDEDEDEDGGEGQDVEGQEVDRERSLDT